MRTALALAILLAAACTAPAVPPTGTWRAVLESPGGDLPFGLELAQTDGAWRGWITNGAERIEIGEVRVEGPEVVLDFPHYDAHVRAELTGSDRLVGRYWRQRGGEKFADMPFVAQAGAAPRFTPGAAGDRALFVGRWSVDLETEDEPAAAIFEAAGDGVHGTFLTATGDYRFLAGDVVDGELRLSVFDGAHAFLFHARITAEGTLEGNFWSSNYWHETWTARRDPAPPLADSFALTRWTDGADLSSLSFPDLSGTPRRLDDPEFAGRARIFYVFGSWCPNCADATEFLVELHERYADRGLSILGLAFEHTGRFERDSRQVRRYAERHGVTYPLLVAGLSDKAEASRALPILDRVLAYPTTIFVDAEGQVRAIHTGFAGPATGEAYHELRARFVGLVEAMLELPAPRGR